MDDYFEEEDEITEVSRSTLFRILEQVKPHWPMVVGFLALVVGIAVTDSIFTYLGKVIIDQAIIPKDTTVLRNTLTIFAVMIVVSAVAVFGFIYLTGVLGEIVRYDLRRKQFDHLQKLSFSYFDKTPVGWIMSRVTSDTERIADLVTWGLLDTTWGISSVAVAVVFMMAINWRLAMLVVITIPLLVYVAYIFRRRILVQFREVRRINSQITGRTTRTLPVFA
ncbi:MAG: ABC transporter transmembrane domain-containing protein [Chloroflexota bacterium]